MKTYSGERLGLQVLFVVLVVVMLACVPVRYEPAGPIPLNYVPKPEPTPPDLINHMVAYESIG